MKVVLFGGGHHKNFDAIQRMCKSCNIEFENTNDLQRLSHNNYNILLSFSKYINPNDIPINIKIIYGPQFCVLPSNEPVVGVRNDELSKRCVFNILSSWIKTSYLECVNDFIIPMKEFPFSVDTERFKPLQAPITKEYDCIVYIKRRSNELVNYTLSLLNQKGMKYRVFKYGSYNEGDYVDTLRKSKFMLTLDAHESQGFALEEAMSCGVPLLVMDATSMYDEMDDGVRSTYAHLKPKRLLATSVPYWSNECGICITEQSELSNAIDIIISNYQMYRPRDYIVRTLSDEVCMRRILDYFQFKDINRDINRDINTMSTSWDDFTFFTNDNDFLHHIGQGKSEPYDGGYNSQLNIVKRYVSAYPVRTRTMLDVGAHIGTTMLPYSRLFKTVYGFEPNKESYDFCVKNIEHNNVQNCFVENCAVLNRKTIGIPVQHNTCNTGCFYFKEDSTNINGIPSKVLDEDMRLNDVDFIKIDTEGAEYYVILGAIEIIKKYKPLIQAEVNGLSERNFGIPKMILIELLTSLGYQNLAGTDFFIHNEFKF